MSYTTNNPDFGRLCNQIIRNLCTSKICEKHNLYVTYGNYEIFNKLGFSFFIGKNKYKNTKVLNDDNFFSILNMENFKYNINPNKAYFQNNDISNYLYDIITRENKKDIIDKNYFNKRYNNNKDIGIHIRLGDKKGDNPGLEYYITAINQIKDYDNIYVFTDSIDDDIIQKLSQIKKIEIMNMDEVETLHYCSTCKYIILSHGAFSYIIGCMSFYSIIYYPDYKRVSLWCGDIFSNKKWNKI